MKRILRSLVLLGVLTPTLHGLAAEPTSAATKPAVKPGDLFTNAVLATGKDVSVTRSQLDELLITIKANAAAQNRNISPEDQTRIEQQLLDGLISRQLLLAHATTADKTKGKQEFDAMIAKLKSNLGADEFEKKLSQQLMLSNQTRERWETQGIEENTIRAVLDRELAGNVTETEAKSFYDEHTASFEQPETVRAAHILLSTKDPDDPTANPSAKRDLSDEKKQAKRKQMEDLLKRARAGEDFGKLAKEFSEDPGSKETGGEYTFSRGRMVPEFEAAAFSLNTNQISDIITTAYGYHIIKLYEKLPAKKEPFIGPDTKTVFRKADGQSATIREVVSEQAMQQKIPDYLKKLKADSGVKILDEKLKLPEIPSLSSSTNKPPTK
jgi:parvulin-like peptidyl-prolyl isomerase